jgi:hypothetical protein
LAELDVLDCPNCAAPLDKTAVDCPQCGLRLKIGGTLTAKAPPQQPTSEPVPARRAPARVVSEPEVVYRPRSANVTGLLLRLAILIALAAAAISAVDVLTAALFPFLLVGIFLLWVVNRLGLGSLFRYATAARPRARPSAPAERPWIIFRMAGEDGVTEVELEGHDHGISLGDVVVVTGPRLRGAQRALRIRNLTSRRTLYAVGLAGRLVTLVLAILDLCEVILVVRH